jgi:Flp pilus assembly pilin Flp
MNKDVSFRQKMTAAFSRLHRDERGQGMTEYVIILVAIAVVCIAIAVQFGGSIKGLFVTAEVEVGTLEG